MTVSILIITHEEIGKALLNAAETTLGELPLPTSVITVSYDADPDSLLDKLQQFIKKMSSGNELLILTDLFGATPSNIALRLKHPCEVKIVTGLNLPMLIRVMNYPTLELNELLHKAISGGKDGVISCGEKSVC